MDDYYDDHILFILVDYQSYYWEGRRFKDREELKIITPFLVEFQTTLAKYWGGQT